MCSEATSTKAFKMRPARAQRLPFQEHNFPL
jgi:hypothetical protein